MHKAIPWGYGVDESYSMLDLKYTSSTNTPLVYIGYYSVLEFKILRPQIFHKTACKLAPVPLQ